MRGVGTCSYSNGDVYDGDWREDRKEGNGIGVVKVGRMVYKNGDCYEGQWSDDMRNGKGFEWS